MGIKDPCPKCGAIDAGFYRTGRAMGKVVFIYNERGQFEEVSTDGLRFEPYSTGVRCGKCGKLRGDLLGDPLRTRKRIESK